MNNHLKTTELAEAVEAYRQADYDPQAIPALIELIQAQTDYIQKRFWKMVDQSK